MLVRFTHAVTRSFASLPFLVTAAPLLLFAPAAAEAIQHVVEWQAGMFTSAEDARRAAGSPARAFFGIVKVTTLVGAATVASRILFNGGDIRAALSLDARDRRLFLAGVALIAALVAAAFALPAVVKALAGAGLALDGRQQRLLLLALLLASLPLLRPIARGVAIVAGGRAISEEQAGALSRGRELWFGQGVLVAVMIPPLILHYGLNYAAIIHPSLVAKAGLLAMDSVLVGVLSLLMGGAQWASTSDEMSKGQPPRLGTAA